MEIGIDLKEGVGNVFELGSKVPTRNVALLVERLRGIAFLPTLVANPKEDKVFFGNAEVSKNSAYVVQNIFDNLAKAPLNLYEMRVVGADCVAASAALTNVSDVLTIKAGRNGLEDVGTWANGIVVNIYKKGVEDPDNFVLEVLYNSTLAETKKAETLEDLVNKVNGQSKYIMIEPIDLTLGLPADTNSETLANGVYNEPTEADYYPTYDSITDEPKGLAILLNAPINLIATPEIQSDTFVAKADVFCRDNDLFFIHSLVKDATTTTIQATALALKTNNQSFTASYLNWVEVDNQNGGRKWIPSIGYVIGAGYVRVGYFDNNIAWSVPAGDRTYALGIYDFSHKDIAVTTLDRYTTVYGINTIRYTEKTGFIIWSSRTMSTNSLYNSIHVRLQTNWIVQNLLERNLEYRERLLTPSLKGNMKSSNLMWFKNIYNKGGLEGSIPFEKACIIVIEVSKENRKEVLMTISWIPTEKTELITIELNRNDGVLAVVE